MQIEKDLIRHWGMLFESVEQKDKQSFMDEEWKPSSNDVKNALKNAHHKQYSNYKRTSDPSYNDVLAIRKALNLGESKFVLTNAAYDKLSDEQKQEINMYANQLGEGTIDDQDEKDYAQALTLDMDKIFQNLDTMDRNIHHIDSDGLRRDDEGNQLMSKALADVLQDRRPDFFDKFMDNGGKVEDNNSSSSKQLYLFICEKIWAVDGSDRKPLYSKLGTLAFSSKKKAVEEVEKRIKDVIKVNNEYIAKVAPEAATPSPEESKFENGELDWQEAGDAFLRIDPYATTLCVVDLDGTGKRRLGKRGPKAKTVGEAMGRFTFTKNGRNSDPLNTKLDKAITDYFISYTIYRNEQPFTENPDGVVDSLLGSADAE